MSKETQNKHKIKFNKRLFVSQNWVQPIIKLKNKWMMMTMMKRKNWIFE